MKSVVVRLLARERGLFAGALVIAAACAALGVPFDFVLFGDAKKMLDEVLVALKA